MAKVSNQSKPTGLPIIQPFAAGIDIGSRFHVAAVSPGLCDQPVQTFQAFTSDLQRMADWLIATGTKTVVMESTGVYWVAAYEVFESRGLEVILANAREARAVPGRKSDINDAQWLQRLHACGLLRASFRPGRDIAELRAYLRAREKHTDYAAAHIQHMQKVSNSVQNFPDFRGDQRPKVATLGCVTYRRFCRGIWGVKHGSHSRNPASSFGQRREHQLDCTRPKVIPSDGAQTPANRERSGLSSSASTSAQAG